MTANEKIKAVGEKVIADATGRSLSVVYRWAKALSNGDRIGDRAMRELIAATAGKPTPILWTDFQPMRIAA